MILPRLAVLPLAALLLLCATGAARAQDDAGSNPELAAAVSKLAALKSAEAKAKNAADDAAATLDIVKAKTHTEETQLADAKTKAATDPSDKDAASALETAAQALKDGQDALLAAVAKMNTTDMQVKALADAVAEQKAAVYKLRATAGAATPSAQPADPKLALAWWLASAAQAVKGHFVAVAHALNTGKPGDSFRYDHFSFDKSPAIERVVMPDGAIYVRVGGKEWAEALEPRKGSQPIDEKRLAEIGALEGLARGPIGPVTFDSPEGKPVWRPVKDAANTFEHSVERPAAGAVYPKIEFGDNKREDTGMLARTALVSSKWEGKPADVKIDYFYLPAAESPDAAVQAEEVIAEALRDARARPVMVDCIVHGPQRVRVAGIISGKDFDLTVLKKGGDGGAPLRQIAVAGDFWTSGDGGRTWQKQDEADRTYYDMARTAMGENFPGAALQWFFPATDESGRAIGDGIMIEDYEEESDGGAIHDEGLNDRIGPITTGEPLRHFKLDGLAPTVDRLSYWVEMKEGRPVLRRITNFGLPGRRFPGQFYTEYADVPNGQGVLPPPGNAAAAPVDMADDLLAAAVKAMDGRMWWADLHVEQQTGNGQGAWSDPQPAERVQGLFSGRDFDLTTESVGDAGSGRTRQVGAGEKAWAEGAVAGTWSEINGGNLGNTMYKRIHLPLEEAFTAAFYRVAGTETHGDETWLRIRQCPAQQWADGLPPEYWLLLDKAGKPVAVRRCAWTSGNLGAVVTMPDKRTRNTVDFTPAKEGEKIVAPEAAPQSGK